MITIGIAIIGAILYFAGWYSWAFWLIAYAIINGALAVIWAIVNPGWYFRRALAEDVKPSYPMLFVTKGILISVLVVAAWHVGTRAGYF